MKRILKALRFNFFIKSIFSLSIVVLSGTIISPVSSSIISWPIIFPYRYSSLIERYSILGEKYDDNNSVEKLDDFQNKNVISLPLRNARKLFEKNYLQSQINRFDGNISKTAAFIGMERSALHRKLKQLGITEEDKQ